MLLNQRISAPTITDGMNKFFRHSMITIEKPKKINKKWWGGKGSFL